MTINNAEKWNASLNLGITGFCRNIANIVEVEKDIEKLLQAGMPEVLLTILSIYYKKSSSIT